MSLIYKFKHTKTFVIVLFISTNVILKKWYNLCTYLPEMRFDHKENARGIEVCPTRDYLQLAHYSLTIHFLSSLHLLSFPPFWKKVDYYSLVL